MSKEHKITLENYNYEGKGPQINSPNSIKALQSIGLEEKDLKKLTQEEYVALNPECKKLSEDLLNERYDNYIQRHLELINKAKEKRNELISENKENSAKKQESKIYHCDFHSSSTSNFYIPKGKINPNCEICNEYSKKYEKLKERMKINIQLEIDNELTKMEKMQKQKNIHNKLREQEEKTKYNKLKDFQDRKEREILYENERKKRQEDLKLSIEKRRKEKEDKEKFMMNEKMKRRKELELEREMYNKEKDRKGQEVKRQMESLNEKQMQKLLNKQKMLEDRDEKRKMRLEEYKKNNAKTLNETYALKKDKVNKTLCDFDYQRQEKNRRYFDNQKKKTRKKGKI